MIGLPVPLTPQVGRERELKSLQDHQRRDEVRLVTHHGPGGTGQNPLALQILEGKFQEGDHILVKEGPSGAFVFERADAPTEAATASPVAAGV